MQFTKFSRLLAECGKIATRYQILGVRIIFTLIVEILRNVTTAFSCSVPNLRGIENGVQYSIITMIELAEI